MVKISTRRIETTAIVDISGDIDLAHSGEVRRAVLIEFRENRTPKVILNLQEVNYIDSSGIGELVHAYTSVKTRGGELKLLHLTKKVRDLLQITKLYTVFEVYSDEPSAVRSFD